MDEQAQKPFTAEDVKNCWSDPVETLVEILNGDFNIEEARDDLRSLIGSEYDGRVKKEG